MTVAVIATSLFFLPAKSQAQSKAALPVVRTTTAPTRLAGSERQLHGMLGTLAPKQNSGFFIPSKNFSVVSSRKPSGSQRRIAKLGDGTEIYGNVIYSKAWADGNPRYGMYSFSASSNMYTDSLQTDGYMIPWGGGTIVGDKYHVLMYYNYLNWYIQYNYYEYNVSDWSHAENYGVNVSNYKIMSTASVYDPTTKQVYACLYNMDGDGEVTSYDLGTIDYTKFQRTSVIKSGSLRYLAMGVTSKGELYAVDEKGDFYHINKTTGEETKVGATGVTPYKAQQSGIFNPKTDKFYWAAVNSDQTTSLYEIDPANGAAQKISDFPNNEEVATMYIPSPTELGAPSSVDDLQLNFAEGSNDGTVSFTLPATTYNEDALKGQLTYHIIVNGAEVASGTGNAGQKVAKTLNIASGETSVKVYTENAAGKSPETEVRQWIGPDAPKTGGAVSLKENSDNTVTLSWTAPTTGVHGGFIDSDALTYDVVRYPGAAVVASGISRTTFTEQKQECDYSAHYYTVTPVNKGVKGAAMTSDTIRYGNPLQIPYVQDFQSDSTFYLMDVINANKDNITWQRGDNGYSGEGEGRYNGDYNVTADDWLLTPPLELKKGLRYKVSLDVRNHYVTYAETFDLAYGQGTDPSTYTKLISDSVITNSTFKTVSQVVAIPSDGVYRFGIHVKTPGKGHFFYIDNLKVDYEAQPSAPDSVTSLVVKPGANGAHKATISFKAPTKTVEGKQLSSISKIDVMRNDGSLVQSIANPSVAASLSVDDNAPSTANGFNKYTVVASNQTGDGMKAEKTAYIGIDTPQPVTNVVVRNNFDGTATLVWDAPSSVGVNGGYVDVASLTYTVYNVVGTSAVVYKADVTGRQLTIDGLRTDGSQANVYYAVTATSEAGRSDFAISNLILEGGVYSLPFHESVSTGNLDYSWSVTGVASQDENPFGLSTTSADNDGGALSFVPHSVGQKATLGSGMISLGNAGNPHLVFKTEMTPLRNRNGQIVVSVRAGSGKTGTLTTVDFSKDDFMSAAQWKTVDIDLSSLKSEKAFQIFFEFQSSTANSNILIDDINIRDVKGHDLAASLSAPENATAGRELKATVNVANYGSSNVKGSDYTVSLLADGKQVATAKGVDVASNGYAQVPVSYKASVVSSDSVTLQAVVNYDADEALENNTSTSKGVHLAKPNLPSVDGLSVSTSANGKNAELSWNAVTVSNDPVTDDFESYQSFANENVGDWTFFNEDGMSTYTVENLSFSHAGDNSAFIVFDNTATSPKIDLAQNAHFVAHSGSKYLMSFDAGSTSEQTSHYAISPELSGKAQTVTFWVKSFAEGYIDSYDVLYSTTDNDPYSFTKVAVENSEAPLEWTKVSVNIPVGAKYFAIHANSLDKFALMIDDVTYEGAELTLTGYNVYRDGELLETVPAGTRSLVDSNIPSGEHRYTVSAVYNLGESAPAEAQTITGIATISTAGSKIKGRYDLNGLKVNADRQGVQILKLSDGTYRKVIVK